MNDELEQVRDARPHVDPPSPRVVHSARSSLMAQIQQSDHPTESRNGPSSRRRLGTGLLVVSVLATAAAGWAVVNRGGNLPDAAFEGETWELVVGEESNGGDGTFKVCHSFRTPNLTPADGNGLGGAGCETSPADAPAGAVIVDAAAAIATPTGVVILVDLTTAPVGEVVLTADTGEVFTITPFVMPQSGERFVAAEMPGTPASVSVDALDPDGVLLDSRVITDLAVG